MLRVRIDRREHFVIHELAQLRFGQPRQLAELFEQEFVLLVQPIACSIFTWQPPARNVRAVEGRGLGKLLEQRASRSLVTVGTAIWTIAKRSPSPPVRLGEAAPGEPQLLAGARPGGTLRRTDPARVGTCTSCRARLPRRERKIEEEIVAAHAKSRCGCKRDLRYQVAVASGVQPLASLAGERRRWPSWRLSECAL